MLLHLQCTDTNQLCLARHLRCKLLPDQRPPLRRRSADLPVMIPVLPAQMGMKGYAGRYSSRKVSNSCVSQDCAVCE